MRHLRSPFLTGYIAITLGLSPLGLAPAFANPQGGQVAGGSATIQGQGTATVTVNQASDRAIINWNTFNLSAGDLTRFVQPGASSIALNRVTGGLGPSQIYGTLSANGRVFLVNPNGVLFGQGAVIDTAGFLATTSDVKNDDFMAGKNNFTIPGNPAASIVNLGQITATNGGIAALVAPGVRNSGTITADFGKVAMASANGFTLDFYGDKLITLQVGDQIAAQVKDVATGLPLDALVKNEGVLKANGGRVELTAVAARQVVDAVINNTGVIEANTVGTRNGMIVLGAATAADKGAGAPAQNVKVSGKLLASGRRAGESGGKIQITGENIALTGARINASGKAGGGKVLIGGDVGGGNGNAAVAGIAQAALEAEPVATASSVSVDAATRIDVSAKDTGNGGKLVVWSDQLTSFAGSFQARGGANGGDGGFAEVSSKGQLSYNGFGDLRAPAGTFGTLLLDPYNLTISDGTDANSGHFTASGDNSVVNGATLLAALSLGSVIVSTGDSRKGHQAGNINVATQLSWSQATTLTLIAASDITIGAAISAANGGLTLNAGRNIAATAAVNVGRFTLQKGAWSQVGPNIAAFSAADFRLAGGSFLRALGGHGTTESPYQITDVYGLQGIGSASLLGKDYVLANNIDASGTAAWNGGAGFTPIGDGDRAFTGKLDGASFAVSGLTINSRSQYVGLFGYLDRSAVVTDIGLINANVTSSYNNFFDYAHVGALAGYSEGTITRTYATGTVSASSDWLAPNVGGLVGTNDRKGGISQSYASVAVAESGSGFAPWVGGLVGRNRGAISQSYADGAVSSSASRYVEGFVGGLVGYNSDGSINQSYATGTVSGGSSSDVGGLVGSNAAAISQAYASGHVSGGTAGGLVGANWGSVAHSFWDTGTTAQAAGIGRNLNAGATTSVVGLSTTAARQQSSYAGWNFSNDGGAWFMIDGSTRPFLRSEWSSTITNAHQLQLVTMNPGATYTLGNNIDLGPALAPVNGQYSGMWGPQGFAPIGTFTGSFDGLGQTISGLTIAPTGLNNVNYNNTGLFSIIGVGGAVSNLNLSNANVTANPDIGLPGQFIGILAGSNAGTITNVSATGGQVNGVPIVDGVPVSLQGVSAGGLVGQNGLLFDNNLTNLPGSITNSHVTNVAVVVGGCSGSTCASGFNAAGGLVGSNVGGSSISSSFAQRTVTDPESAAGTVTGGGNGTYGGLVGQNGFMGGSSTDGWPGQTGTITGSWANVGVTSSGTNVMLGGLVGLNAPGSVISSSQAYGVVTAKGQVPAGPGENCGADNSCNYVSAGGLVGQNSGTITGLSFLHFVSTEGHPAAPSFSVETSCAAGFTCASGAVIVGPHATGGGLVGQNDGVITYAFATGSVIGAAGVDASANKPFDNTTRLGGLAGANSGSIDHSLARGDVGSESTGRLTAGGLVGDNAGMISYSRAYGMVSAGDGSVVGGLVGNNNPADQNSDCLHCFNFASIGFSSAYGAVVAGDSSVAGGLVGYNRGSPDYSAGILTGVDAHGNVNVGSNSFAGGLVGVQDQGGSILVGGATGNVFSAGSNSVLGGLVGSNAGQIAGAESFGNVTGGSNSYIGGLVGINVQVAGDSASGVITNSFVDPVVTGTGAGNVVGGLIGFNAGFANTGEIFADVSSGPNSIVGAFAGVSAGNAIVNYTFTGSVNGNSVTNTIPTLPPWVPPCDAAICGALQQLVILSPPPPSNPDAPPPPINQVNPPQSDQNNTNTINLTQPSGGSPPSGGTPPSGNGNNPPSGNNGPPPGAGIGRTLNEQQFSGVPPIGETRFLPGEVVVQISNTVSADRIAQLAQQFGFTIISSQSIDGSGRTIYQFKTANGQDIRTIIRALESRQIVASAQPNYVFNLAQDAVPQSAPPPAPPPAGDPSDVTGSIPPSSPELSSEQQADMASRTTLPAGDAGQYIIDKLHLGAVHARALGRNVTVAVIDSEIDVQHPDLQGVVTEQYDATGGTASSPHAHGTGMAGAIASKRRLLGIAPGVRILAVKAFDETSTSAEATSYQILKGLDFAISKHVRIINMSFAGPRDLMMERSLQKAYDQGIVLIAAAGNAGPKSPPLYPAADANVIAVSATDYADKPFAMANRGKYIAVAAPGVDVLVPAPKGAYQLTTGTSVAAAHVSGVAALLLESQPLLGPKDVRSILVSTAHLINPKGRDDITGAGLVDPYQALTTATARAVEGAPASRITVH